MNGATICHGCGQRLEVPEDYQRAKMRCPACGVMCEVPPADARKTASKKRAPRTAPSAVPATPPVPAPSPPSDQEDLPIRLAAEPESPPSPPPEPEFGTDEDDGKPYRVTESQENKCPECGAFMRRDEKQCPRCGFDLKVGKKRAKSMTPVERSWEAGWPLRKRRNLLILGLVLVFPLGLLIAYESEAWMGFVGSLILFGGMGAFILGTYARVELSRNKRGKITLTKTWRVFFMERPPIVLNVLEFEGVRTGLARDVHLLDWIIAGMLLPAGIICGVLWWYFFIQSDSHYVALLKEHGYPSDVLYQGMSEALAKDIAGTLRDVAGLPYEQG
jgi:hypothetical protein